MRSGSRRGQQEGLAYLLLLVCVALLGLTAATSVSIGVNATRRNAEYELLAIGSEFERALASYRAAVPAGGGPREVEDLLLDRRTAGIRRHLRKLYADPLTGRSDWGLVRHPDGSIAGVFSMAAGTPIKRSGFEGRGVGFEEAKTYADWVFGVPPRMSGLHAAAAR